MTPDTAPLPFDFRLATREVIYGAGRLDRLSELAAAIGALRVAVVADGFVDRCPLRDRITRLLGAPGRLVRFHVIPDREPDTASVESAGAALGEIDPDMVVAVGGGSAMDTAKVARMMLSNPGDVAALAGWDRRYQRHPSRFVCVPTTAGTASEVSEMAVVTLAGSDVKLRYRDPSIAAEIALLDPELLLGAPPAVTANAGFDAFTHALEAYVSRLASPLTDPLAWSSLRRLAEWLPIAHGEPLDLRARAECLIGSVQAGVVFNSTQLGLAHAISAPLGAIHHVTHGLGNALALPAVAAFNEASLGAKRQALRRLFGTEHVYEGVARLRRQLGLDRGLDEFVATAGERRSIADAAMKSGNVASNPRSPGAGDVERILELARRPLGDDAARLAVLVGDRA